MAYLAIGTVFFILLTIFCFFYYRKSTILFKKNAQLQKSLELSEKKAQNSLDFISSLSQELRPPLYGIMGLTNILTEENPALKDNQKLKSLKFTGDYLLTLINTILQVNYLDNAQLVITKKNFNLKELTKNIVHSFSYATENKDNTLHFEFDDDISEIVHGEPTVLSQILMNLISNALRFTRNGNVYFSVNLIKQKENTYTLSFKVKHDGIEISEEDEKSIYEEFIDIKQVKKSYLGTGLNATIVKKLASLLQGKIIIQDTNSQGSEYAFVMDFTVPSQNSVDDRESIGPKDNLTVLIVDDNKLNLLVAEKMLSKEQFECTTIDNGFDAIELVRENDYVVILMDINMPKLNGIGTTKRIREFNKNTPIIALTAVDVTQLNRQIIQAGFNDYILKPYNKKLLMEKIDKHLLIQK